MSEWKLVGKPALVIVHMQNAVIKSPSPFEILGHGRAAEEEGVIGKIQQLLRAFRAKGLPVVFMVAHTPLGTKFPAYGMFWDGVRGADANRKGTWDTEIIEELSPIPGEAVFYNWPFNIFMGSSLEQFLQDQGIETVVLTGVATGMSVGTAAFALADRFYNLIVPSDTTADGNRQLHDAIINGMIPAIGLVTTADDVIAHLYSDRLGIAILV
ncbi:MAG: cysteine hydrolase [Chloroflexi bacterium]|nr:cysteine hydrolase [Chloroflexota bacterium]